MTVMSPSVQLQRFSRVFTSLALAPNSPDLLSKAGKVSASATLFTYSIIALVALLKRGTDNQGEGTQVFVPLSFSSVPFPSFRPGCTLRCNCHFWALH